MRQRSRRAGAAVIHTPLRDDDDFTTDLDVARRTADLVCEKCPAIVQQSTGGGFPYEHRMQTMKAKPAMTTCRSALPPELALSTDTTVTNVCATWAL